MAVLGKIGFQRWRRELNALLPLLLGITLSHAHTFLSFISRQISLQIQGMLGHPGKHFIFRDPDVRRDPDFPLVCWLTVWVLAFAGMTDERMNSRR
jgi:hypothetical protein